jgi:hypothetical protein
MRGAGGNLPAPAAADEQSDGFKPRPRPNSFGQLILIKASDAPL